VCTKRYGNTPIDFSSAVAAPGSLQGISGYASLIAEEKLAKKYRFMAS